MHFICIVLDILKRQADPATSRGSFFLRLMHLSVCLLLRALRRSGIESDRVHAADIFEHVGERDDSRTPTVLVYTDQSQAPITSSCK